MTCRDWKVLAKRPQDDDTRLAAGSQSAHPELVGAARRTVSGAGAFDLESVPQSVRYRGSVGGPFPTERRILECDCALWQFWGTGVAAARDRWPARPSRARSPERGGHSPEFDEPSSQRWGPSTHGLPAAGSSEWNP